MDKTNASVMQTIYETVKTEKRSGQFPSNLDVWDAIPPIVESVQIDMDYVRKLLDLDEDDKSLTVLGVLNKLLGLFGVQAIKKEGLEVISLAPTDTEPQTAEALLCVDNAKLSKAIDSLAKILAEKETAAAELRDFQIKKSSEYVSRINALEQEMATLRATNQYFQDAILRNLQELCSLNRENDAILNWAKNFLSELAMRLVWSNEGSREQLDVRFNTLKSSKIIPEKPCIMKDETVIIKGLVFEQVAEEEAGPES